MLKKVFFQFRQRVYWFSADAEEAMNSLSGKAHQGSLSTTRSNAVCRRLLSEAAADWESGKRQSAFPFLLWYGELLRMGEHCIPLPLIPDPALLAEHAMHPGLVENTTDAALYYLNIDERRFAADKLWRWACGFSNLVLERRDELQLVLDAAFSLKLQAAADNAVETFSAYITALAQLDEVLLQSAQTAELALRFFRRPRCVDPQYDLSFYWWFGPHRRVTARGTKGIFAAYDVPSHLAPPSG